MLSHGRKEIPFTSNAAMPSSMRIEPGLTVTLPLTSTGTSIVIVPLVTVSHLKLKNWQGRIIPDDELIGMDCQLPLTQLSGREVCVVGRHGLGSHEIKGRTEVLLEHGIVFVTNTSASDPNTRNELARMTRVFKHSTRKGSRLREENRAIKRMTR